MPIQTTSIKDIFKKKVDDTVADLYDAPTIWRDSNTGEEHEDYEYVCIRSESPAISAAMGHPTDTPSYTTPGHYGDPDWLVVNGPIKQVGSHVIKCGKIHISSKKYPYADRLDQLFKFARNLEELDESFDNINTWPDRLVLPEDLFWNCPKLIRMSRCFGHARLAGVPPKLLYNCHSLESVNRLFYDASGVEEIPEDFFKNNPNIKDFRCAFEYTLVKKIPQGLLTQFKEGIEKGDIDINYFVKSTPLAAEFGPRGKVPKTPAEKKAKRDMFFPTYLSKEVQWGMMGHKKGYSNF